VAAIGIVAEPVLAATGDRAAARDAAATLLRRLNIPERLWDLPPATFSGGEQQRVNIARGFLAGLPVLLLDEPTASLDAANKTAVVDLIMEKKRRGVAILAVVHDDDVRTAIADRLIDVAPFSKVA
jgi:alpha-D-ribose 1-methylphosphonate 5-triphosphate synthase subunit PhnL